MPPKSPRAIRPRRVVITGMGVATGLGLELPALWRGLLDGRCAIRALSLTEKHPEMPVKIAGQVDDEELAAGLARYDLSDPDRTSRLGLYVIGRALEDAGLPVDGQAPLPLDMIIGSGHGTVSSTND